MNRKPSKKILEEKYIGKNCRVELLDGEIVFGVLEHNHNGVDYEKNYYRCVGEKWNLSFRVSHIDKIFDLNKDTYCLMQKMRQQNNENFKW